MKKSRIISFLSLTLVIVVWKISAHLIDANIILPPPEEVVKSLLEIIKSKSFVTTLVNTLLRGIWGFAISFIIGTILGIVSGISKYFQSLIKPVLIIMRSTPVISVILIALIWFPTDFVPVFVSFLMAFPIICETMIEGVSTIDRELLQMAKVYRISFRKQLTGIYIPSLTPFIISSAGVSLGIIWKVVVAAEVLSQPEVGIGTSLNEAKAFLLTEEVFAWTIVAITFSYFTEKFFKFISNKFNWRVYEAK